MGESKGKFVYYCYILRRADDSFYVGVTDNPAQRVRDHNDGRGANWTAARPPRANVELANRPGGFDPHAYRTLQIPVERLGFSRLVIQPPFGQLPSRLIQHRDRLVARVKITSYNHHRSAPFFRALVVSATKSTRRKEPTTSSNQPEVVESAASKRAPFKIEAMRRPKNLRRSFGWRGRIGHPLSPKTFIAMGGPFRLDNERRSNR